MNDKTQEKGQIYNVCVLSILEEGWVRALELEPLSTFRHYSGPARTTLELRLSDQSELLGLLNRLHNMNLTVLSVQLNQPRPSSDNTARIWDDF